MQKAIKHAEGYSNVHDVFMFAQMHLSELGEIYWFRGESEASKGNKTRSEHYIKKYHEVHDCKRELDLLRYITENKTLTELDKARALLQ